MKPIRLSILWGIWLLAVAACGPQCVAQVAKTYSVTGDIHVWLEGKTNVAGYQCHCRDKMPLRQVATIPVAGTARRTHTLRTDQMQVRVRKLDCGNPPMNADMYKALNADSHPWFTLELLRVRGPEGQPMSQRTGQWLTVEADVKFCINGNTKAYTLQVSARQDSGNSYQFSTTLPISMYDFGVTPPKPMMGLITVSDKIVVHFDAVVQVSAIN